jgi:hypothetical protein
VGVAATTERRRRRRLTWPPAKGLPAGSLGNRAGGGWGFRSGVLYADLLGTDQAPHTSQAGGLGRRPAQRFLSLFLYFFRFFLFFFCLFFFTFLKAKIFLNAKFYNFVLIFFSKIRAFVLNIFKF